ncbi:MAG: HNH endonuclease [Proteobacteria bacterium]|nr:HNH endonuclease [Pseudomonadota bacterium]
MKAVDFDPSALQSLRDRIQVPEVLEAFDRLVDFGLACQSLRCAPGGRGAALDFRYTSVDPPGWPFSFAVSKGQLVFHIRPLGIRTLNLTGAALARRIEGVRGPTRSGISVVVKNRQEADAMVKHLLSHWPGNIPPVAVAMPVDSGDDRSQFRASLEQVEGACRVTGVMDRRHLRAVHIKPREACSESERVDGNNGLLLSPHLAHLFERGYITFSDEGQLLVARQLNSTVLKRWAISLPISARPFGVKQKLYLAWHRGNVFEKAEAGRRRKD